jgi:hypothetical protein
MARRSARLVTPLDSWLAVARTRTEDERLTVLLPVLLEGYFRGSVNLTNGKHRW